VQSVIGAWQVDWSAVPVGNVSMSSASTLGAGANLQWRRASCEGSTVLLAMPIGGLAACGQKLLGLSDASKEPMCEHIAQEAIEDLMARLCASKLHKEHAFELLPRAPADADISERHGNVGFVLAQPFPRARLFMDAGWCDEFVPIQESRKLPPLSGRRSAIADIRVEAKATIELGALSIHDSLGLSVGEVLLTDARTDAVALLSVGDRGVASGTLTNSQDSRAMCLTDLIVS
jgi:hypothetical protein